MKIIICTNIACTKPFHKAIKVCLFVIIMAIGFFSANANDDVSIPMPSMAVPKLNKAPIIDGVMDLGEWDRAAACTGFVPAYGKFLAHVQTVVWFGYDDTYFYVCFKNYRTKKNTLLSKRARGHDDINIVFDHANEIWLSPPEKPPVTFQAMFNAYPAVWDEKKIPSLGNSQVSWSGKWELKSSENRNYWIIEGRAPITAFSNKKIKNNTIWRGLFTSDDLAGTGGGFTAWASGTGFDLIDRHGFFHFFNNRPSFQLLSVDTLFTGKVNLPIAVAAPAEKSADVKVTLNIRSRQNPDKSYVELCRVMNVPAGSRQQHIFKADLTALNLPLDKESKKNSDYPSAIFDIKAVDSDGTIIYSQSFPFCVDGFVRTAPSALKTSPYDTPFGVDLFHAPLSQKLIVKLDRYYMPERNKAISGTIQVFDISSEKPIISEPIKPFINDYSETILDISKIKLPIETSDNWKTFNKKGGIQVAKYPVSVRLTDVDGRELAKVDAQASLIDRQYEWLNHKIGISDKVIPPWIPMIYRDSRISMWNKTYKLNALGLAEKIINNGRTQLSGPMELIAVKDGRESVIKASQPKLIKLADAGIDLSGITKFGDLDIRVKTRVEFDGFVLNTMILDPRKPVTLDRLSMLIRMPAKESECFNTTAGGWSASAGFTPDKWSSKDSSSGSRYGSFVPYIFLTDSDRGFCWFADNDKNWVIDPIVPEQEMWVDNKIRTLQINFIGRNVTFSKPITITYGWMVTPQKPQPEAWRAYQIYWQRPYPMAKNVFYTDADRVEAFHYYSCPYPHSYKKSRKDLEPQLKIPGVIACVGQAGESLGKWKDYKGRNIDVLKADWGVRVGGGYLGIVTQCKSVADYRIWHYNKWIKKVGLSGIYFDLNYLSEEWNYLNGTAYFLPDNRLQPGYSYLGFREFNKRLRYIFYDNGFKPPYIWMHTTMGHPVYSWMPDIAMEGENILPSSLEYDYQDAINPGRLRSIVNGRQLGAVPTLLAQASAYPQNPHHDFLVHQLVGWLLGHDCLPNYVEFWSVLASEMEMWHNDIEFIGYWKNDPRLQSKTDGIIVSAHIRPGHAVLWINNTKRKNLIAKLKIDLRKLGFNPAKIAVFDAETGKSIALLGGELIIPLESRMWRAVRIKTLDKLSNGETFIASFDEHKAIADEALGNRFALGSNILITKAKGYSGGGLGLDKAISFSARQHVSSASGKISFIISEDIASSQGVLCEIGPLQILAKHGQLEVYWLSPKETTKEVTKVNIPSKNDWLNVAIAWKGKKLQIELDDKKIINTDMPEVLPISDEARGLKIAYSRRKISIPTITFGPLPKVIIDDLKMQR
jgi:hypothetical protein